MKKFDIIHDEQETGSQRNVLRSRILGALVEAIEQIPGNAAGCLAGQHHRAAISVEHVGQPRRPPPRVESIIGSEHHHRQISWPVMCRELEQSGTADTCAR